MIISKDSNDNWTPVATGNGTFVGTKAAFDAVKDDLPDNTVAYTTDDGTEFSPRSTSRITIANNAGNLVVCDASAATEYTASDSGMVVAHVIKNDSGNTCNLFVNDVVVDSFPYYSPTISSTAGMCEITLTAFVRKGDKIKVYCDGNGDRYALANILIQTISWYK